MSDIFINIPNSGSPSWKSPVINAAALPAIGNTNGDTRVDLSTDTIYIWNGTSWIPVATPGAAIAIDGLIGDVSASGPGVVVATVNSVGGKSAANIASATTIILGTESANTVFAGPSSGSAAAPTFRLLLPADIPVNDNLSTIQTTSFSVTNSSTFLTYLTDTTGGSFNVTLAAASTFAKGKAFIFLDVGGVNEANPLVLIRNGSDTIGELSQNKSYYTNFGAMKIISDGVSNWLLEPISNKITRQYFNSSGTYIAQAGITEATIYIRGGAAGAGGGGGGAGGSTTAGAGAGGGGSNGGSSNIVSFPSKITPGTSYPITIGAGGSGGAGGTAGSNGGAGGDASVGSDGGLTSFSTLFSVMGGIAFSYSAQYNAVPTETAGIGGTLASGSLGGIGGGLTEPYFYGMDLTVSYIPGSYFSGSAGGLGGSPGISGSNAHTFVDINGGVLPEFSQTLTNSPGSATAGATNGGGGGAGGIPMPGDKAAIGGVNGGNGGVAGSNGTAGQIGTNGTDGLGGFGGGGGGGGGALAVTGTSGGVGGAGGNGSNGLCIVEWVE